MKTTYDLTPKYNPKTKTYTFIIKCPHCGEPNEEPEPIMFLICEKCNRISRLHDKLIMLMNQLKDEELRLKLEK